jgi:hypothetical protein
MKSSYALGRAVVTENVIVSNCNVSGFKLGTFLDGTLVPIADGVGRIKFGTESNGGFRNCTVTNCLFTECRGLAIESVDGGLIDNIVCSDLTMKNLNRYGIYITLGSRLRNPNPGISTGSNITISNVNGVMKDSINCIQIFGTPNTTFQKISFNNIQFQIKGGGTKEQSLSDFPELGKNYPDPTLKMLPAYGIYARHIKNLALKSVRFECTQSELRPPIVCVDVDSVSFVDVFAKRSLNTPFIQFESTKRIFNFTEFALDTTLIALRDSDWMLFRKGVDRQLFNLKSDISAKKNVALAFPDVLANMTKLFKAMFVPNVVDTTSSVNLITSQLVSVIQNPVGDFLKLRGANDLPISICNVQGEIILKQIYSTPILVSQLNRGFYWAQIQAKGTFVNIRFIKK